MKKYIGKKQIIILTGMVFLGGAFALTTSCGDNNLIKSKESLFKWIEKHRKIHSEQKDFDYIDDEWNPTTTPGVVPITDETKHADFLTYFGDLKNFSCREIVLCMLSDRNNYWAAEMKVQKWTQKHVEIEVKHYEFDMSNHIFGNGSVNVSWESTRNFKLKFKIVIDNTQEALTQENNVYIDNGVIINRNVLLFSPPLSFMADHEIVCATSAFAPGTFGILTEWDIEYPNLRLTNLAHS